MAYIYLIQTSVESVTQAQKITDELMNQGMCACVQMLGSGISTYPWQGAIEQAEEYYLRIKTTQACKDKVVAWLGQNHPYALPEIVWARCETTDAYATWVEQNVSCQ